jgi:hypothetical protein
MGEEEFKTRTASQMEQEIRVGCVAVFPNKAVYESVAKADGIDRKYLGYWTQVCKEWNWKMHLFDKGENHFAFGVKCPVTRAWFLCTVMSQARDWYWLKVKNPAMRDQKPMWDTFERTEPHQES